MNLGTIRGIHRTFKLRLVEGRQITKIWTPKGIVYLEGNTVNLRHGVISVAHNGTVGNAAVNVADAVSSACRADQKAGPRRNRRRIVP